MVPARGRTGPCGGPGQPGPALRARAGRRTRRGAGSALVSPGRGPGFAGRALPPGQLHDAGKGVAHDPAQAAACYLRAAEQGHLRAQFDLGLRFESGSGVPVDAVQALHWYRRAAEQDYAPAQHMVGVLLERDGTADPFEAVRWYLRAAEGGHAPAQFALGLRYDSAHGVARDYVAAFHWYACAARRAMRVPGSMSG
ncbi:tetratricopeptide repeat protein [Massilia sp. Dwa41.01b]|uniref:tetratricopeptide repeat protein n=1 Tax=Massilia sp. Dwa41.01b TaxID=2709302 RepID=UPI001E371510|nr:tetratricopeptide repeat protein [Massilia sp. Dwa41.01b]